MSILVFCTSPGAPDSPIREYLIITKGITKEVYFYS
jgi:hypothetical protein